MWRLVRGTGAGINWLRGPASNILLTSMQRRLLLDPADAQPLIKALFGRWYYSEDRLRNVIKDISKEVASQVGSRRLVLLSSMRARA